MPRKMGEEAVQQIGVLSSLRLYMAVATVSMMSRSSIDVHVGNSGTIG